MCSALVLGVSILFFTTANEVSAEASCLFSPNDRIVGGYNVTIEQVPYQAHLVIHRKNGEIEWGTCGGVIISTRYILTAAHCVIGATSIYVTIGSTMARANNYQTTNFITHPKYDPKALDYDVGLVKLNEDMNLDQKSAQAAQLAEANSEVSPMTVLLVSGWGRTEENGTSSQYLQAAQVPAISQAECAEKYKNNVPITDRMICSGYPEGGVNPCHGDSGGPALSLCTNKVVGLVSFGEICADPRYPAVYTNIAAVRSWIDVNSKI